MSNIAEQMDKILKSASHKSLFNDYKKASDENNVEMMEPGPSVKLFDKEQKEPFLMAKYPHMMQLLELIKAEDKFPALMQELRNKEGRFGDVSNADDLNYNVDADVAAIRAMVDVMNDPTVQKEFDDMVASLDLPETNELTVSEELEGMGDMPVAEDVKEENMDYVAANLAIDSLITASAALDKLSFSSSSQEILKVAAMVLEAKKKTKKDKEEEEDDEDDDDKDDKKSSKKSKKDKDDDDKDDKKSKKSKKDKDDDDKDKDDKKSKKK